MKGVSYLAMIGSGVDGENPLCGTDEVAIGMAHPELSHVPGIVGERARDVGTGALSLSIHGLYVIDEQDDFNAAAALPRREKTRTL